MDEVIEITACDICGSSKLKDLVVEDASINPLLKCIGFVGEYKSVLCKTCGWIFNPHVMTKKQLDKLYGSEGGESSYDEEYSEMNSIRSKLLYELLNKSVRKIDQQMRILDVGAGIGQVSQEFSDQGHEVHILDLNADVAIRSEMKVHKGDLETVMFAHKFDLVMMNHVLEHVWYPSKYIEKTRNILGKEGLLFIEVPFELYTPLIKKNTGHPCHVGYFSIKTLCTLLKNNSFDPVWVKRDIGLYNDRKVMVLRGLFKVRSHSIKNNRVTRRMGWLSNYFEILNPLQIYLMLKVMLDK